MKKKDTATSFKKADNKYEWIDVVKKRTKRTDPLVLPTGVPGLVADVFEVRMDEKTAMQLEKKDTFVTDKERNSLESYIFRMRDKPAMRGWYGMSTSSATSGRSPDRWRRLGLLRSGGHLVRKIAAHQITASDFTHVLDHVSHQHANEACHDYNLKSGGELISLQETFGLCEGRAEQHYYIPACVLGW